MRILQQLFLFMCLALLPTQGWGATDTFTGTDTTALPTYSANWGPLWSSAVNDCRIYSNGVNSNTFPCANQYSGRTWANDQYSQFLITTVATSIQAAIVRGDTGGSTRSGYAGGIDINALGHSRYTIWKWVANTRTTLTTHGSQSAATSDVVRLSVVGTTLTLTVNGSDILTTTDSSIASGAAGLMLEGSSATTNYSDTWQGDDIASSATVPNSLILLGVGQ